MLNKKVLVIGGGAAGVFGAIRIKELYPDVDVCILEKTLKLLTKVKISGGGRCNVTHHQFDPKELIKNYPRGQKELLGPFNFFSPEHMIEWLESKGVQLKVEKDGRMFPQTDSSQTIIDCFLKEIKDLQITVKLETELLGIEKKEEKLIVTTNKGVLEADTVLIATGSMPKNFELFNHLDIPCVPLVPSLFTFHIPDSFLTKLSGTVFEYGQLKILHTPYYKQGPILVTHFGLSGPCTLKLSAFAANDLNKLNYKASLELNVDASTTLKEKIETLLKMKTIYQMKQLGSIPPFNLTKNAFIAFLEELKIDPSQKWGHIKDQKLQEIAKFCHEMPLKMEGKSTFKEEFVTSGGIDCKFIHLKTMEHKSFPRLYFAGEVLNIDGITGGFNFQNAWTTATLAACGMKSYLKKDSTTLC